MNDVLQDYAESAFNGTAHGDEVLAECIECGAPKMYLNTETGLVYCFKCDYRANLVRLLQDAEGLSLTAAIAKSTKLLHGVRTRGKASASFEELTALLLHTREQNVGALDVPLPRNTVKFTDKRARPARDYLRSRGYGRVHWRHYGLLYVYERDEEAKRFYRHIVFPVRDGARVVYWTTRAAYEPPKHIPKSYHPQGVSKHTLFGIDVVPLTRRTCVLVEGPLDALALPGIGVAALGKSLSDAQAAIIAARFSRVLVCFDADTVKETYQACARLTALGVPKVLPVRCPWKDPGTGVAAQPARTFAALRKACAAYAPLDALCETLQAQ